MEQSRPDHVSGPTPGSEADPAADADPACPSPRAARILLRIGLEDLDSAEDSGEPGIDWIRPPGGAPSRFGSCRGDT